jgi:hypothetical protein
MRALLKAGTIALLLAAAPFAVQAGTLEGVTIGAGTGAVIAGPPGAVVGGVIGYVIGGPDIVTPRYRYTNDPRNCWLDSYGYRHCARR